MVGAFRKIKTLHRLTAPERRLALAALGLVALTRAALWVVPFRWIEHSLERCHANRRATSHNRSRTARDIAWAIRLASRYVPRATCLTQALAAQVLLIHAGIKSRIVLGVSNEKDFRAHAWVESEGSILLGNTAGFERYAPILTLTGAPRKSSGISS
jgi:hypothetical protein